MLSLSNRLPSEVWTHVFGFLSPADKLRVRATCKLFKHLIDHRGLWKDWTVKMSLSKGAYTARFWRTLRRRRVSSAAVKRSHICPQLARELPDLTTLLIHECTRVSVDTLRTFTSLKKLCLKNSDVHVPFRDFLLLLSDSSQLSHLSLCHLTFKDSCLNKFPLPADFSQFVSLKSLVCHSVGFSGDQERILYSILSSLPQLQHLSLSTRASISSDQSSHNFSPLQGLCLSRLELVDCSLCGLSRGFMKLLPSLQSLAVFYTPAESHLSHQSHLTHWFQDLPRLSSLLVVNGPDVREFAGSIPASVTDLTLRPLCLSAEEMRSLSVRLPHLQHLHLEPHRPLGKDTVPILHLFPRLKVLRVAHKHMWEQDFIGLPELELLEIRDCVAPGASLLHKLRELNQNRFHICTRQTQQLHTCNCVGFMRPAPSNSTPADQQSAFP